MPKAVRYDGYGGIDVLEVRDVEWPVPGPGLVLVEVKAAGINPGEATIRKGALHHLWPATFPSGQGSDLAGIIVEIGEGVSGFAVGDEILGFTHNRASHAEYVLVEADHLVRRPAGVSWEVAGSLFVAATAAYASIRAIGLRAGETVAVSGATGGVGSIAVQLARLAGATVIGLASPANHDWLTEHGAIPVAYGEGMAERIRAVAGGPIDAFVDTFGSGYVDLALELGVRPDRINTIIDFPAAEKHGVKAEGNNDAATAEVLAHLADLVAEGKLDVPIAKVYPLAQVHEAFREVERRHTRGKIVLKP